jgi:DNA mismatch repair protein MSH4
LEEELAHATNSIGQRNIRCFAVKLGINGLLDVARQTYKETMSDIYAMSKLYEENHALPIKLQYARKEGFYLTLPIDYASKVTLPDVFVNAHKKRKQLCFSTLDLARTRLVFDGCR